MRLLILSWVSTRKHLLFWWLALAFLFYLVLPALPLYHFPSNLSTRGFSDDGRFVALTNQNESRFVDITNSEEASRSKKITGMDYYYGSGPIRLLDTVSRQELFAVEDESVVVDNIGFSNDGEFLVGSLGGCVKAWDTNTGTNVLSGVPGKLYSVVTSDKGLTAAIVLAPNDESQELWEEYRGTVHVVDVTTGRTISKFGPVSVPHETSVSWGQSRATLWISSDMRRAATYLYRSALYGNQYGSEYNRNLQIWDLWTGELIQTVKADNGFRQCALSPNGSELVMLHDRTRSTNAVPEALARIEVWDLNSGQITGTFTANRDSGEELSIGGTTRMECLGSSQSLLLRTAAGPALMRLRDKQVSMIAYHAFGTAVSPDGKYYAEGTGKVVNNAFFWNETKDQGLSIRRTSDDAQVYERVASDSGAKWGTTFDPLGFSRDNRLLAYSEPLLPLIGKMQAWTARFLSSGKIRGSIYPRRLRIIEVQTGKAISSYVYWSFLTKGHFRFLPNGEHMMIGRNVFAVQSRAPWLFIATLPMLILALIWSWSVLRASKRSAKDVGEPQSPLR